MQSEKPSRIRALQGVHDSQMALALLSSHFTKVMNSKTGLENSTEFSMGSTHGVWGGFLDPIKSRHH
jgi:hypothetical protein